MLPAIGKYATIHRKQDAETKVATERCCRVSCSGLQRIPRAFPARQSEVAAVILGYIAHFTRNWILETVSNQEGSAE